MSSVRRLASWLKRWRAKSRMPSSLSIKVELEQVGWTKATELAKDVRREGQRFDSAAGLHRARELAKEEFKYPAAF